MKEFRIECIFGSNLSLFYVFVCVCCLRLNMFAIIYLFLFASIHELLNWEKKHTTNNHIALSCVWRIWMLLLLFFHYLFRCLNDVFLIQYLCYCTLIIWSFLSFFFIQIVRDVDWVCVCAHACNVSFILT